jgi:glycosyltransferase involved in cell wall biosynthesis
MPQVISSLDDAHLLIAGDGPLHDELREQTTHSGIQDHVSFVGSVSPIEPYYATADVFVLPSREEGLPITLLEAMAAELPVVATDIPGISEVVQEGKTDHLVPPGSPSQLAEAMIKTVTGGTEQFGQAGYRRVRSEFDITDMVAAYNDLYERCLNAE